MKKILLFAVFIAASSTAFAQVGIGTTTPAVSSALDITSTTKGLLIPRMTTTQRTGIATPATGLQVYDTTTNGLWYFNGTIWVTFSDTTIYSIDGTIPAATNRQVTLGDRESTRITIAPAGEQANIATLTVIGGRAGGGVESGIAVASNYTDNTTKHGIIKVPQFVNANPPVQALWMRNTATSNTLSIGGINSGSQANPTNIDFFVDADTDLTNTASGLTAMSILGVSGNVGINKNNPSEKLDVAGNVRFSGALMPNNVPGTAGQVLTSAGAGVPPTWAVSAAGANIYNSNGTIPAATNRQVTLGDRESTKMTIAPTGEEANISTLNVIGGAAGGGSTAGITIASSYTDNADKHGIIKVPQFVNANPPVQALWMQNLATGNNLFIGGINSGSQANPSKIDFYVDGDTNLTNSASAGNIVAMTILGVSGNVGIDKNNPSEKLDVTGNVRFSGALMPNNVPGTAGQVLTSAGAGAPPTWAVSASGVNIYNSNGTLTGTRTVTQGTNALNFIGTGNTTFGGNVGIGTTSPAEKLDVQGNLRVGNSTTSNYIAFNGTNGDGASGTPHTYIGERYYGGSESSEMLLYKGNDNATTSGPDRIRLLSGEIRFDSFTTGLPFPYTFEQVGTNTTDVINRMIINSSGNVGIGTTTPTSKLQVVGLPTYSSVAAAQGAGALTAGAFYRVNSGTADVQSIVRIKY